MRICRLIAALLFLLTLAHAQIYTKRLILKDGSYQAISEYQVNGDRVHYHSIERGEWEDIPSSLIDWDATNKFNTNPVKNDTSRANRDAVEDELREQSKSEAESPTVAPRLRLPDSSIGGVYLLDDWKGRPELAEIVQDGTEINKNTRKNILRAVITPIGPLHQSFELQGAHAHVQSHLAQPTIYICVQSDEKAVDVANHYRLVRVESNVPKNTRSVGTLKVMITGNTSQTQKFVASTASKVNEGAWVKIVPNQPREPGEYAVIEMLSKDEMNMYVWDFGVNPAAAENLNITPQPPAPAAKN